MKKKPSSLPLWTDVFEDKWGIKCCECSHCKFYIPNVFGKEELICPDCNTKLWVRRKNNQAKDKKSK